MIGKVPVVVKWDNQCVAEETVCGSWNQGYRTPSPPVAAARTAVNDGPERGASMVEYAVLVGMIAIIALVALQVLGQKVSGTFSEVAEPLASD